MTCAKAPDLMAVGTAVPRVAAPSVSRNWTTSRGGPIPSLRGWDDPRIIKTAMSIHRDDPRFGYQFVVDRVVGLVASGNRTRRCVLNAGAVARTRRTR